MSGQKFIKNAEMVNFGEFLKPEAWGQTVLPDIFKRTKIGGKCQKFKCDILSPFQTMCKIVNKSSEDLKSKNFLPCKNRWRENYDFKYSDSTSFNQKTVFFAA